MDDVAKLAASVKRNLKQEHRFLCITDRPCYDDMPCEHVGIPDIDLTRYRGCFARLRMFDPDWQTYIGANDRLVSIDLDTVITGPLDELFNRREDFVIMQGGNSANPCPYNGAMMMIRQGAHPELWTEFSLEAAGRSKYYEFPDDQGWIWTNVPDAAGWKCGSSSGVYVFHKPGWPGWEKKQATVADNLPRGAKVVTFSGWRSPKRFAHLDWVRQNWHDGRKSH
jgi:hypothetical protein